MWEFRASFAPEEVVCLRPPGRHLRYLLRVRSETCRECSTGVRHQSVWVTRRGSGECLTWCEHCFDACCQRISLDEELRAEFRAVQSAIADRRVSAAWRAARPALRELERRTLFRQPE